MLGSLDMTMTFNAGSFRIRIESMSGLDRGTCIIRFLKFDFKRAANFPLFEQSKKQSKNKKVYKPAVMADHRFFPNNFLVDASHF